MPKRTCPNCHAVIDATGSRCPVCKLEIAQMDAFAAAKAAAQKRGLKSTRVEEYAAPLWKKPSLYAIAALLLIVGLLIYHFSGIGVPPAWSLLPATKEDAARKYLTYISTGQDAAYDKAYALMPPSARDPAIDDEVGKYHQIFQVLNNYLTGEFGADWITTMQLEQDPNNSDVIDAHIREETIHIQLAQQTPADKDPANHPHYGVMAIQEFDIHDAADLQKMAAINSIISGIAGQGAENNLQAVIGAAGRQHETLIQAKLRLLPDLRDPRHVNKYEVYQTWPFRQDPVFRHRLQAIVDDGRYDGQIQDVAKEVLNNACTEDELIAAHAQY